MDVPRRKKSPVIPRMSKERIIVEYLSGHKSSTQLAAEYGTTRNCINQIVCRSKISKDAIFTGNLSRPIMAPKKSKAADRSALQAENEELKRQLKSAQLKIEGYQIMSDILEEEYGIDLLKKAGAGQSRNSKKSTRK